MLVLQSCSNSLHILPSSCSETNAALSDCACHIGNMKVVEDLDMHVEEGEVKMQSVKGIGSEEEECVGVKDEEGIYSEMEQEEEDIAINEEEDVGREEEVSLEGTV